MAEYECFQPLLTAPLIGEEVRYIPLWIKAITENQKVGQCIMLTSTRKSMSITAGSPYFSSCELNVKVRTNGFCI